MKLGILASARRRLLGGVVVPPGGGSGTATPPGGLPATHWRVRVAYTSASFTLISTLELRETAGGPNLASTVSGSATGTASGTDQYSGQQPIHAFDNNANTQWHVNSADGIELRFQFNNGAKLINEISVLSGQQHGDRSPRFFYVESSNDGVTWTEEWFCSGYGLDWSQPQTFTRPSSTDRSRWIMVIEQVGANPANCSELRFFNGTTELPTSGIFLLNSDASYPVAAAADNNINTFSLHSGSVYSAWGFDFGSNREVTSVTYRHRSGFPAYSPMKGFVGFGSGKTWVRAWRFDNQTAWIEGETRTFQRPALSGSTPGVSDRWRLRFLHMQSNAKTDPQISGVEMRAAPGGANLCVGGTPLSSSNFAPEFPAALAFDGDPATRWVGGIGPTSNVYTTLQWIGYQFPSPVSVQEVVMTSHDATGSMPTVFSVEYWDGATWIIHSIVETGAWTANRQTRTFAVTPLATPDNLPHRYWQLFVLSNSDLTIWVTAGEIEMAETLGGADVTTTGFTIHSSNALDGAATQAFDNNTGTRWQSSNGGGYGNAPWHYGRWIGQDFGAGNARNIREVRMAAQTGVVSNIGLFLLRYSDDGVTWTPKFFGDHVFTGADSVYRTFNADNLQFVTDVAITGVYGVGNTLTATFTYTPANASVAYVWKRNGVVQPQTGANYLLSADDTDAALLTVEVTLTRGSSTYTRSVSRVLGFDPAFRYWRLNMTSAHDSVIALMEMELYETQTGGTDMLVPSTPVTASTTDYGWVPSNLVNGDPGGTGWHSGGGVPQWVQFDLGYARPVNRMVIASRPLNGQCPKDFTLAGSDSPTGPWTTTGVFNEPVNWAGQTKSFIPGPAFTSLPKITGSHEVGATLTVNYGAVLEGTVVFAWKRDGVTIPGATAQTYVVQAADANTIIQADVGLKSGLVTRSAQRAVTSGGVFSNRWRVRTTTSQYFTVSDIEMRAYPGTADQTSGGTANASSTLGGTLSVQAANVYDNDSATNWHSASGGDHWSEYQFASPVQVNEVAIRCRTDDNTMWMPSSLRLEYWDGSAWVLKSEVAGVTGWARGVQFIYDFRSDAQIMFGPELIDDPSFDNPGAWITGGGWSVTGGNGVAANATNELAKTGIMTAGKRYRLSFPYTGRSGGNLRIRDGTNGTVYRTYSSGELGASGTVNLLFSALGSPFNLQADAANISITIPSISLKEII
jgi:hypothetical protein